MSTTSAALSSSHAPLLVLLVSFLLFLFLLLFLLLVFLLFRLLVFQLLLLLSLLLLFWHQHACHSSPKAHSSHRWHSHRGQCRWRSRGWGLPCHEARLRRAPGAVRCRCL